MPRPASRRGIRGETVAYAHSPYRGRPPIVTPALVVDAVVFRQGKVLLVRRGRPPWRGWWALPGGFVEIGESCEHAVLRELAEETALRGRIDRVVGVYSDPGRDPRAHLVSVVFAVTSPRGSPDGGDDAAEARWWPVGRLPRLAADHRQIIADARAQVPSRVATGGAARSHRERGESRRRPGRRPARRPSPRRRSE
jgi:8-oxo-dGTP diphosphatase